MLDMSILAFSRLLVMVARLGWPGNILLSSARFFSALLTMPLERSLFIPRARTLAFCIPSLKLKPHFTHTAELTGWVVPHDGHTVLSSFPQAEQNAVSGPLGTRHPQWGHLSISLSLSEKLAGHFFL